MKRLLFIGCAEKPSQNLVSADLVARYRHSDCYLISANADSAISCTNILARTLDANFEISERIPYHSHPPESADDPLWSFAYQGNTFAIETLKRHHVLLVVTHPVTCKAMASILPEYNHAVVIDSQNLDEGPIRVNWETGAIDVIKEGDVDL